MLWMGAAVVAGAFLLFLVQPMAGKVLLPLYGGSAAVWSACLLFFQSVLLLGYVYAHFLARALKPRAQAAAHGAVVLACVLLPRAAPQDPGSPPPAPQGCDENPGHGERSRAQARAPDAPR